jgi:hypothetical protein
MKVIHTKYLPVRPFGPAPYFLAFLSLERFNAPGWLYGVVFCLLILITIITAYCAIKQKLVHPSELDKP